MISEQLLAKIRCPCTGDPLSIAGQEVIDLLNLERRRGKIFNNLGTEVEIEFAEGLVNSSTTYFIMVDQGIPDLVPDQAIPIDHLEFSKPTEKSAQIRTDE